LFPGILNAVAEVGRELEARKIKFVYRTEIARASASSSNPTECLLVNTTGELKHLPAGDFNLHWQSLTAQGGQNPIEPGALGKPMVFGPNMQNFTEVVTSFLTKEGAIQVKNAAELERVCADLLADSARREKLGQNALAVVQENQGAIDRTADMIVKNLDGNEVYIAPQ
jgi:3-deoxy-D-manno-octulosonic-acid transferase